MIPFFSDDWHIAALYHLPDSTSPPTSSNERCSPWNSFYWRWERTVLCRPETRWWMSWCQLAPPLYDSQKHPSPWSMRSGKTHMNISAANETIREFKHFYIKMIIEVTFKSSRYLKLNIKPGTRVHQLRRDLQTNPRSCWRIQGHRGRPWHSPQWRPRLWQSYLLLMKWLQWHFCLSCENIVIYSYLSNDQSLFT